MSIYGDLGVNYLQNINNSFGYLDLQGATPFFTMRSDVTKPVLIVKGMSSQTGNLQEWQDSSGNVLSTIASNGSLRVTNISSTVNTGAYTNHASDSVTILQRVTTAVNLIVKGVASQTADLQQWQNSSGTALALVDAYGRLGINTTSLANSTGGYSMVSIINRDH